jgi:NAD(P)-dependent dehydrogenase (short-subunit alcohol dehydrogenase family)
MSAKGDQSEAFRAMQRRLELIQRHLERKNRSGRMAGKVCIITGAGSPTGIGRASAIQFAHEGASHLYLLDFNAEHFEDFAKLLKERYPDVKVHTQECDAADEEAIQGVIQKALDDTGRLDVFFANAARAGAAPLNAIDVDDLTEAMRVNVNSCFIALKHASEAMKVTSKDKPESAGSIIMTASVAGMRSGAGPVDYSATKAAVISLVQTGAWQLARTNIRVNGIAPGLISTGKSDEGGIRH